MAVFVGELVRKKGFYGGYGDAFAFKFGLGALLIVKLRHFIAVSDFLEGLPHQPLSPLVRPYLLLQIVFVANVEWVVFGEVVEGELPILLLLLVLEVQSLAGQKVAFVHYVEIGIMDLLGLLELSQIPLLLEHEWILLE